MIPGRPANARRALSALSPIDAMNPANPSFSRFAERASAAAGERTGELALLAIGVVSLVLAVSWTRLLIGLVSRRQERLLGRRRPLRSGRWRAPLAICLAILMLGLSWLASLAEEADRRTSRALARVVAARRGLDATSRASGDPGRPAHAANATALSLEALAAGLGVPLAPAGLSGRALPAPSAVKSFESVRERLSTFLRRRARRPDEALPKAPAALANFLATHRDRIGKIRDLLSSSPPPHWEIEGDRDLATRPSPSFLGQLKLQRLLALSAHEAGREGRDGEALSFLQASDRLNVSLRERPECLAQYYATTPTIYRLMILRRLENVQVAWADRLSQDAASERAAFRDAVLAEAHAAALYSKAGLPGLFDDGPGLFRVAVWPFYKPFGRLWLAGHVEGVARLVPRLEDLSADEFLSFAKGDEPWPEPSHWDILGPAARWSLTSGARRLARVAADYELTALVVRLKARAKATDPPVWERGHVPSEVLPGAYWHYAIEDGVLLEARLDSPWPLPGGSQALSLPLQFVNRRGSVARRTVRAKPS